MPENNTQPATEQQPPVPTFSVNPLSSSTVSGVMGATPIDNQNRKGSSVAVWIGFGMILIAMIIAGAYYYMTMIQPESMDVVPPEVNVPAPAAEQDTTSAELDAVSASIDASTDFSDVEKDLDDISAELDTVQ